MREIRGQIRDPCGRLVKQSKQSNGQTVKRGSLPCGQRRGHVANTSPCGTCLAPVARLVKQLPAQSHDSAVVKFPVALTINPPPVGAATSDPARHGGRFGT